MSEFMSNILLYKRYGKFIKKLFTYYIVYTDYPLIVL